MSIEKSLYEQLEKQFVQANSERWELVKEKTKLQLRNSQLEHDLRNLRAAYTSLEAAFEMQKTQISILKALNHTIY